MAQPCIHAAGPAAAAAASTAGELAQAHGLILIGASAGGTQAIEAVLSRLPAETPPVLIVQHMPAQFTRAFASRLDGLCAMTVVEATGGERLTRGVAYVAPGDSHLLVEPFGGRLRTVLKRGQPVHYQRPAVDVLFHSAAQVKAADRGAPANRHGRDGAEGSAAEGEHHHRANNRPASCSGCQPRRSREAARCTSHRCRRCRT